MSPKSDTLKYSVTRETFCITLSYTECDTSVLFFLKYFFEHSVAPSFRCRWYIVS